MTSGRHFSSKSRASRKAKRANFAERPHSEIEEPNFEKIVGTIPGTVEAVPVNFTWSETVFVTPPKKQAISIRLDEDVLAFFKRGGAGYQGRINSVLRYFVEQRLKKERA